MDVTQDPIFPRATYSPEEEECLRDRKYWVFLLSIVFTFVSAITFVLLHRFVESLRSKHNSKNKKRPQNSFNNALIKTSKTSTFTENLKYKAQELIEGQSTPGKILVSTVLILTFVSFKIYYYDTRSDSVENCQKFTDNTSLLIDLALNILFLLYFCIRLIAASDKLWFMFEIYSVVDFLTIPPSIVVVFLDRTWIGFRCTRAFMFMLLPHVLRHLNIIKSPSTIRLLKIMSTFLSVILTVAGCLHLLENSGDPFEFKNGHLISYYECIYFTIFTIFTIGYGGVYITTTLGRGFLIVLLLICLVVILWYIIGLIGLIRFRPQYSLSFNCQLKSHIIVCGHLTHSNVSSFLNDFYHEKRKNREKEVVLLDTKLPEPQLEDLMMSCLTKVKFFRGSVLNRNDLKRVKAHKADACLVFCNKQSEDQNSEDATNIMRVMSIKNYCKDIRVIIQLMQSHNKYFLFQIPKWNPSKGDQVICISDIKLGFIGQSCSAQGLSTLLTNLISLRSIESSKTKLLWKKDYLKGTKMGIFIECLSPSFDDMTFAQTAELCFTKLKLLLLAVEEIGESDDKDSNILINPRDSYRITKRTKGFFIAKNDDMVKRAFWYCLSCHNDITDEKMIKKCNCLNVEDKVKKRYIHTTGVDSDDPCDNMNLLPITSATDGKYDESKEKSSKAEQKKKKDKKDKKRRDSSSSSSSSDSSIESNNNKRVEKIEVNEKKVGHRYDSTAMFHWCPDKTIEECILEKNTQELSALTSHVIVGIFAVKDSPLIGLKNLLLPIRTSNIKYKELKPVLIVGNIDFIRREWKALKNIPKINVFNGSLLCREDLKSVNIIVCNMCIILSSSLSSTEEVRLVDKEAILASLNVKTMTFDDSVLGLIGDKNSKPGTDPKSIIRKPQLEIQQKGSEYGVNIPLITELLCENNVQYFLNDSQDDRDIQIYQKQSFASGTVFTTSVIDSFMSETYFNSDVLSFIKSFISGGLNTKLESVLSEEISLRTEALNTETLRNHDRCRVTQISLKGPFAEYSEAKFGQLFLSALKSYGILCFGIYRLFKDNQSNETPNKRYVITNPSADFGLNPNDLVFAFLQMDTKI